MTCIRQPERQQENPMLDPERRGVLGRLADAAIAAAFLALAAFAFGAVFVGAGQVMTAAPEFSGLYRPDQNPWTGAIIAPERLASGGQAGPGYRPPPGSAKGR
jgi:hypothetical protein